MLIDSAILLPRFVHASSTCVDDGALTLPDDVDLVTMVFLQ